MYESGYWVSGFQHERVSAGNNLHIWLYIQGLTLAGILNKRLSTDLLVKSTNLIKKFIIKHMSKTKQTNLLDSVLS